jgi:phospholipase/lecithinase/hemolysin
MVLTAYATTIKKIVVFGDSLSDNGNIYAATTAGSWLSEKLCQDLGISCSKLPIIPQSPPYYQGRFSNGPVWIEDISQMMNLTQTVTQFSDYAFGGAWLEAAGYGGKGIAPDDIGVQVSTYMFLYPFEKGKVDDYLFVIWAGGNDYLNRRSNVESATTKSIKAIHEQINKLMGYGAKIFLIPNLPDLGATPWATSQGHQFAENLTALSLQHNQKLAAMILKEQRANPNVKFITVDAMQFFKDLDVNGSKYGLKNVKDACYDGKFYSTNSVPTVFADDKVNKIMNENIELREAYMTTYIANKGQQMCVNPDEYLFWDHVHPTKIVHQLLANYVLTILKQNNIY